MLGICSKKGSGVCRMVQKYQKPIVESLDLGSTYVPLARKMCQVRLQMHTFVSLAE